jgi:hypothetical protein
VKFLITWQIHPGEIHETLGIFSQMTAEQEQALMGSDVKLLGRWHDLVRGSGAAIFEATSVEALSAYAMNWNQHMDLDIAAVVDDEQARAVGKQMQG